MRFETLTLNPRKYIWGQKLKKKTLGINYNFSYSINNKREKKVFLVVLNH